MSTDATPLLDHRSPEVAALAVRLAAGHAERRDFLLAAHRHLVEVIHPVYSLDERRSASRLLREAKGSCSQRMACLEALARAHGIPTRVRALFLRGRFWAPRLPLLRPVLRRPSLIPWPEFDLGQGWVGFEEIFAPLAVLAGRAAHGFTNRGESMFEAVEHTAVDFFGKLRRAGHPRAAEFDLSPFVEEDAGVFASRDALLERFDPDPPAAGRLLFNLLYGGRTIRREPD